MQVEANLIDIAEKIAAISENTKSKISYFIVPALFASAYLAWWFYQADSALWWNLVKLALTTLPVLLWLVLWYALNQLQYLPIHLRSIAVQQDDQASLITELQQTAGSNDGGVVRVFKLLWQLKTHDGIADLIEVAGGLGLIINPLFAVLIGFSGLLLLVFMFFSILLLIF